MSILDRRRWFQRPRNRIDLESERFEGGVSQQCPLLWLPKRNQYWPPYAVDLDFSEAQSALCSLTVGQFDICRIGRPDASLLDGQKGYLGRGRTGIGKRFNLGDTGGAVNPQIDYRFAHVLLLPQI